MHQYEGLIIAVPDVLRKARMNDIRGHIHPDIIFNGRVRCVTEELDQVPVTDVVGFEYRARRQSWAQHSVTELFHATALIPQFDSTQRIMSKMTFCGAKEVHKSLRRGGVPDRFLEAQN